MNEMIRYSIVKAKNEREIVMLKGKPCIWGKCAFCDYISDNETEEEKMISFNHNVLNQVTGNPGVLEVINSGSVFELPDATLAEIKQIVSQKNITKLFFESYWSYRHRLQEIKDYFKIPIFFKCGLETFDNSFRNQVLKKGFLIKSPEEVAQFFQSVCLMVGIQGQTKEMIQKDMDYLTRYFEHGCINIFVENSTSIKADNSLITWFRENYSFLEQDRRYEILWHNTDFGVGGAL